MGIKCGIVGLPNVGKSTLFNALTASAVAADNYPFCTIAPNVGVVSVPDPKLEAIADVVAPARVVPTVVEFVDIAGLVRGASKGEGLGNRFLARIRETDAIVHLVRCFTSEDVTHVPGKIDPLGDIEVINTELLLADTETVERSLEKASRQAKTNEKAALAWHELLKRVHEELGTGRPVREMSLGAADGKALAGIHLISAKPVMYVANVDESASSDNPYLEAVQSFAAAEGAPAVAISASLEAELAQLDPEAQREFLHDLGLEGPGLKRLIHAAYRLLDLQTFYTANSNEAHAWTLPRGASAYEAAGRIHTDFQRGFIRAEVIPVDTFLARQGEQGAREAGKMRLEGRDYVVAEGDVIHFRFNV